MILCWSKLQSRYSATLMMTTFHHSGEVGFVFSSPASSPSLLPMGEKGALL